MSLHRSSPTDDVPGSGTDHPTKNVAEHFTQLLAALLTGSPAMRASLSVRPIPDAEPNWDVISIQWRREGTQAPGSTNPTGMQEGVAGIPNLTAIPAPDEPLLPGPGIGIHLIETPRLEGRLLVSSEPADGNTLEIADQRLFVQLPLLTAAMDAILALGREAARKRDGLDLSAERSAVFALTRDGRLLAASPSGQDILAAGAPVRTGPDEKLRLESRKQSQEFDRLIEVLSNEPSRGPFALQIEPDTRSSNAAGQAGSVTYDWLVLSASAHASGSDGQAASGRQGIIHVRLKNADDASIVPEDFIAQALNLTSAEARLVSALVSGISLKEHADTVGRSEHTMRWHIGNILTKTGCRNQREIVRLVLKLLIN